MSAGFRGGWFLCAVALILAVAGCGHGSGASSPEEAVERFLAAFANPPEPEGSTASEEVMDYWAGTCEQIDPRIRPHLRFSEEDVDPLVNCGAVVVLAVLETGDTGQMIPPSGISGTPVSADTSGAESIVTVDVRFESSEIGAGHAPEPPAEARVKVLTVKHDGGWWVATPQAFNPLTVAEGGLSESQLRDQHREVLLGRE